MTVPGPTPERYVVRIPVTFSRWLGEAKLPAIGSYRAIVEQPLVHTSLFKACRVLGRDDCRKTDFDEFS